MSYTILESRITFQGHYIRVRSDTLATPSGRTQQIEIVEHSGAVAIVPIDAEQNVWLVRQYRHPAGEFLLEIPAGTLNPDEDPADCARRESREEIGMAPGELIPIGAGFMAPGYSTEFIHFFLARQLIPSALEPDEDEDLELVTIPLEELWAEISRGTVQDIKTIAGIALARQWISRDTK
ncbi:MAG: NUDIX hydrolase [Anaerolineales bacterium]|nr:MAG: NUDIX hydrolase [Anaerolineales bacterium]